MIPVGNLEEEGTWEIEMFVSSHIGLYATVASLFRYRNIGPIWNEVTCGCFST